MKIAVDAMGGDYAPREIVLGALEAVRDGYEIILVGDREKILAELDSIDKKGLNPDSIEILHTTEVIDMDEHPAAAVRRKKDSSIVRSIQILKEGKVSAFVSAGNTGAVMTSALLGLGRIKGIERPAIASVLPSQKKGTVFLDVGANLDCKPKYLVQFAIMGSLYAEKILGITRPKVALLNVGVEECKGNELTQAVYLQLKEEEINFVGNIEGRDIFKGDINVIICDGFVGNIVLKTCEGLASSLMSMLKEELARNWLFKIGTVLALPALKRIGKKVDYTEYGGVPLLGVNGVVVVSHGSSNSYAVRNAIKVAAEAAGSNLVASITESIATRLDKKVEDNNA
ncbi:MAG: phosphate acyltransferase PlsX [Peptococcaceae bacterium]|nr:phosphate acyltransferase PlsX [Peptococcaceae bacterium]